MSPPLHSLLKNPEVADNLSLLTADVENADPHSRLINVLHYMAFLVWRNEHSAILPPHSSQERSYQAPQLGKEVTQLCNGKFHTPAYFKKPVCFVPSL